MNTMLSGLKLIWPRVQMEGRLALARPARRSFASLRKEFGDRFLENVTLARFTSARVGGPADGFIHAGTTAELQHVICHLWQHKIPFAILGGGSNVLVSDAGFRGVIVFNRSRPGTGIQFDERAETPQVWVESGVNFGFLARQAALRGLSGLEWAAGIPGTVGGAVVGNAGAHGSNVAGSLVMAKILQYNDTDRPATPKDTPINTSVEDWLVERLDFHYRQSALKGDQQNRLAGSGQAVRSIRRVVLAALFRLERSTSATVIEKMETFRAYRRQTQPPGASMGSMFKNPPGDYAGRLIESAGLKGARVGDAEISTLHANFFVNIGHATAADVYALIRQAQKRVAEQFGVNLELEIELLGEWDER